MSLFFTSGGLSIGASGLISFRVDWFGLLALYSGKEGLCFFFFFNVKDFGKRLHYIDEKILVDKRCIKIQDTGHEGTDSEA